MLKMEMQTFSGYKLTQALGEGAMGTVYKGVHVETGQEVAVKRISSGNFSKSEYELLKKRLIDEATAIKKLDSPWIVKVLTIGETKETELHLILELMDGISLEDQLKEGKKWTGPEFIEKLARPLLLGLSNLHENGVLHRDIKPANLLKTSEGSYKIADFGLAIFEGRQAKTKTGIIIGTPGYMPPECINNGAQGTTELSDIYSAGVTLYEAIAGKSPFVGKSIIETINRQMTLKLTSRALVTGEHHNCNINKEVAEVIISAMAVDPEKRPQSAREFFDVISRKMAKTRSKINSNLTMSSSQKLTIENRPSRTGKKKAGKRKTIAISFLIVALSFIILFCFRDNHKTGSKTVTVNLLNERNKFIDSIEDLKSTKGLVSVTIVKATINAGVLWLKKLEALPEVKQAEKYRIWNEASLELKNCPLPSLGSFIATKSRSKSGSALKKATSSLVKEIRDKVLLSANELWADEVTGVGELESYMLQIQLQQNAWSSKSTRAPDSWGLLINDSENYFENVLTATIMTKPGYNPAFGKNVELAAAPFKLEITLLKAAYFADSSGTLIARIQGAPPTLLKKLKRESESQEERYKSKRQVLEKRAISLDSAIAITKSVKEVSSLVTLTKAKKTIIENKISLVKDYIAGKVKQLNSITNNHWDNLPPSTKFNLNIHAPIYQEISITNRNLPQVIEKQKQTVDAIIRKHGLAAPLKTLLQKGFAPETIYEDELHFEVRKQCVSIKRAWWNLYIPTVNNQCLKSHFKHRDIYSLYLAVEESLTGLMEGQFNLYLFRKLDWLGIHLNKKSLTERTVNVLQTYTRHIEIAKLTNLENQSQLEDEMHRQIFQILTFRRAQKLMFNLQRQSDISTEKALDDYEDVAVIYYKLLSQRLFPYMVEDTVFYNICSNKSSFVPYISELSEQEKQESAMKGSIVLSKLATISKRNRKSQMNDRFEILWAELLQFSLGRHWMLLRAMGKLNKLREESEMVFEQFVHFANDFSTTGNRGKIRQIHIGGATIDSRFDVFNLAVINLCHIAIIENDVELRERIFPFLPMVERMASQRLKRQDLVRTLREGNPIPPGYD